MKRKAEIDPQIFSARLKAARHAKKWTGEKLAELCEINDSYYRKVENGSRCPSLALVLSLCNALEVSPDYLLGYSYAAPGQPGPSLTPSHQALVQDVANLLTQRLTVKPAK